MDQDFAQKVRKKRLRAIAVAVILIAIVLYLVLDTDVEKADYGDSLQAEIQTAQSLYDDAAANQGNGQGQYAPYTLLEFRQQIDAAEAVAENENSEYNEEKEAWETLKQQVKAFKQAENEEVITAEVAQALIDARKTETRTVQIKDDTEMTLTVDGSALESATDMNLMAKEQGPYYEVINDLLSKGALQGQVLSFYQDGDFGGQIQVDVPIYSEDRETAYVYRVDPAAETLTFVGKATIDLSAQTASFSVSSGGDYVVLLEKIHQEDGETVDAEELAEAGEQTGQKDKTGTDGSQGDKASDKNASGSDGSGNSNATGSDSQTETIQVTIEIRCDSLANDMSKLEDPALEAYVPTDGTILATTRVKVEKGATVFDVLNKVCRNKKIQVESSYTPAYGSYYVEGINYLYEFDGGSLSGWMYKVNGTFPNYGCSEYTLQDGDAIVWCYTCDLGKDVGQA